MSEGSEGGGGGRIVSVDALRGFDMFWIVGAGGLVQALSGLGNSKFLETVHAQLDHKAWEGFAYLDLIFPLFVFLAGMSVVFSLPRILRQSGKLGAYRRIIKRTIVIYLLGIFYYGGFSKAWPDIRLLGVLQRIAICYFFTAILFCHLDWKKLVIVCAAILLGYWAVMALVPVPGVGAGCYEPGRNLANYIDAKYLPGWKWDGSWDPEGLLSTFPAIATCIIGVFAGLLIKNESLSKGQKVLYLLAGGAVGVGLGFAWGAWFPVIKKIWTSSYVLVAGGYSCIALAAFYFVVDLLEFRFWARPFVWIGMNPITIYLAYDIINFEDIARRIAGGDIKKLFGAYGDLVLYGVALSLTFGLARFLYKRKIFIRA